MQKPRESVFVDIIYLFRGVMEKSFAPLINSGFFQKTVDKSMKICYHNNRFALLRFLGFEKPHEITVF